MLLKEKTKKMLKDKKLLKHTNPGQFYKRVKKHGRDAFEDLAFLCQHMEEKHLDDIFSDKELEQFIKVILNPRSKRTIIITEAIAYQVYQKVFREFPPEMKDMFAQDIAKTHLFAKMLSLYADKPMIKQK